MASQPSFTQHHSLPHSAGLNTAEQKRPSLTTPVSLDGTPGTIFDSRKQKGKIGLTFPTSYSCRAFPLQEPNAKIFKLILSTLVLKQSRIYPMWLHNHLCCFPPTGGSLPIIPTFLCILAAAPAAPSPLDVLSLPQHLPKPWAPFKKLMFRQVGSEIPSDHSSHKDLSPLGTTTVIITTLPLNCPSLCHAGRF